METNQKDTVYIGLETCEILQFDVSKLLFSSEGMKEEEKKEEERKTKKQKRTNKNEETKSKKQKVRNNNTPHLIDKFEHLLLQTTRRIKKLCFHSNKGKHSLLFVEEDEESCALKKFDFESKQTLLLVECDSQIKITCLSTLSPNTSDNHSQSFASTTYLNSLFFSAIFGEESCISNESKVLVGTNKGNCFCVSLNKPSHMSSSKQSFFENSIFGVVEGEESVVGILASVEERESATHSFMAQFSRNEKTLSQKKEANMIVMVGSKGTVLLVSLIKKTRTNSTPLESPLKSFDSKFAEPLSISHKKKDNSLHKFQTRKYSLNFSITSCVCIYSTLCVVSDARIFSIPLQPSLLSSSLQTILPQQKEKQRVSLPSHLHPNPLPFSKEVTHLVGVNERQVCFLTFRGRICCFQIPQQTSQSNSPPSIQPTKSISDLLESMAQVSLRRERMGERNSLMNEKLKELSNALHIFSYLNNPKPNSAILQIKLSPLFSPFSFFANSSLSFQADLLNNSPFSLIGDWSRKILF